MAEKEYIERSKAIDGIEETTWYHVNTRGNLVEGAISDGNALYKADDVIAVLEKLSAAAVAEVRHGEWITKGENGLLICSECGTNRPFDVQGDKIEYWQGIFCNICGAKMDGERKEQK